MAKKQKVQHPKMHWVTVTCSSCGAQFLIYTTKKVDFQVQVCSKCHPAYTGKQSEYVMKVDRVAQFMERMKKAQELQAQKSKNKK